VVSRFVRRVRTASGSVAVQVVTRQGRAVIAIDHVGSARTDADLALLLAAAQERLRPGQDALDLEGVDVAPASLSDTADWTSRSSSSPPALLPASDESALGASPGAAGDGRGPAAGAKARASVRGKVVSTSSLLLWDVLARAYSDLGFDALGDNAFRAMVLARIVEPASKADTLRVLDEIGVACPTVRTLFRALTRCQDRDYRGQLSTACVAFSSASGGLASLIMYDCTTLHFEVGDEDTGPKALRKVGMSKEHRVDPQVQVGLLVDPSGFPLEVHLFDGASAETKTLLPVLQAFQARHGVAGLVVVADAGMLSAANLNAIEDAGYSFIVGSRITTAPYDLAEHFTRHGDYFTDGQILESTREMGTGASGPKAKRERRVVYQWSFKRSQRDNRTINAQIARAEKAAAGKAPITRTRFLKISGATKELNQATIDRARQLAGLKGYVTNLPVDVMDGATVIAAYHDLWKVEASFRMAKSDLRARPIFHHQRDSIEAHLTVVFAALAVSRHLQNHTGVTIKKLVQTLRVARSATIDVNGQRLTLDSELNPAAREIIDRLPGGH
jgi:hypothetical protein